MALEIPGYENLTEIGRGGFAVVYRATSAAFGREVAIKVLALPGSSEDDRRRFERERRIVGSLSWHPHIVTIYDSGETASDQPFLVYEYLPGGSLGARLKALGPMNSAEAATAGVQICDALEAAHRGGVLHRDVKPDNVMVDRFGELQLTDFGVAQVVMGTHTSTGTLVGTVSYMAPEIIDGSPASVASDVYAAGSTLFTLLAGQAAFARKSDATPLASVMRATKEDVPNLRGYGVDDGLAAVIERSMAKDPAERFASAAALAEALREVQRSLGVAPTPVRYDRVVPTFTTPGDEDPESTVFRQGATPAGALAAAGPDDPGPAPPLPILGAPSFLDSADEATRARSAGSAGERPDGAPKRKRAALIGAAVLILLLLGGAGTGFALTRGGSSTAPTTTRPQPSSTTAAPTTTTLPPTTTTLPSTTTTTAPPTTQAAAPPPTAAYVPPTTAYHPPATAYHPPATTYHPPATAAPPATVCTVQNGVFVC